MEKIVTRVESAAFRTELLRHVPEREIRDELKSYLAEYRFQLPKYTYDLVYFDNHLRDIYGNESMLEKAARSIDQRQSNWKNASRETAEYQGIQYLDSVLQGASLGDRVIWGSPPGATIDGYGPYGFFFSGIVDDVRGNNKHISMTALRINETSISAYNKAMESILGQSVQFNTPEEFLAQPFILQNTSVDPEISLNNMTAPKKIDDRQFEFAMGAIDPLVKQFILEIKSGAPTDRLKQLFYAIENISIELNTSSGLAGIYTLSYSLHQNLELIVQQHGMFKPPIVGGSCGSSGGTDSLETLLNTNLMNKLTNNVLVTILGETDGFECPRCHFKTKKSIGNQCPSCKITKDEAVSQGFVTC